MDKREGHIFANNLIVMDRSTEPLLQFRQSRDQCGKLKNPQVTLLDGNVYVRSKDVDSGPMMTWSPAKKSKDCRAEFASPAGLRKNCPEFEANSLFLNSDTRNMFKSPELDRYELLRPVESYSAVPLPDKIRQLLNRTGSETPMPGAYPVGP